MFAQSVLSRETLGGNDKIPGGGPGSADVVGSGLRIGSGPGAPHRRARARIAVARGGWGRFGPHQSQSRHRLSCRAMPRSYKRQVDISRDDPPEPDWELFQEVERVGLDRLGDMNPQRIESHWNLYDARGQATEGSLQDLRAEIEESDWPPLTIMFTAEAKSVLTYDGTVAHPWDRRTHMFWDGHHDDRSFGFVDVEGQDETEVIGSAGIIEQFLEARERRQQRKTEARASKVVETEVQPQKEAERAGWGWNAWIWTVVAGILATVVGGLMLAWLT